MSQKYKILVIGDSGIDIFRYIDTYKLSAEAPTGVGKEVRKIINPGMAGNVVECLKALSPNSEILFLHQNKEIVKERIVDQKYNHIFIRVDAEDGIDQIDIEKDFYSLIAKQNNNIDAIIISDYNKGFLKQEDIKEILDFGLVFNIPTFVDTKQPAGNFANNAFVIKINEKEYSLSPNWEDHCINLIVTQGDKGAILFNNTGEEIKINGYKVDVSSVVGAGDEFLAALTLKYLETKNLEKSIDFANYIASISVSKPGVYCVSELEAQNYNKDNLIKSHENI